MTSFILFLSLVVLINFYGSLFVPFFFIYIGCFVMVAVSERLLQILSFIRGFSICTMTVIGICVLFSLSSINIIEPMKGRGVTCDKADSKF